MEDTRHGRTPSSSESSEKGYNLKQKLIYLKIIVFMLLSVGLIIYVFVDYDSVCTVLESILGFISDLGVWGCLFFVGVFAVATCLLVPGIIMTVGGGFVYSNIYGFWTGLILGTVLVFIGASLGAVVSMLIGRFVFRKSMERKMETNPKLKAFDECIKEKGLKIVFLMRLSPVIPYNILNYLLGVTSISLKDYSIANFGVLPGTIAYVYIGSAVSNLTEAVNKEPDDNWIELTIFISGAVLAIVSIVYISIVARAKIKKYMVQRSTNIHPIDHDEALGDQ